MPLYVCDECNGIENTALGCVRRKDTGEIWSLTTKDHTAVRALCTECTPPEWSRRALPYTWHGQFPKEIATEETVRAWGLWPHPLIGPHTGFMHLGKFEYLRPELEKQKKAAARKLQAALRKEGKK